MNKLENLPYVVLIMGMIIIGLAVFNSITRNSEIISNNSGVCEAQNGTLIVQRTKSGIHNVFCISNDALIALK